MVLGSANCNVFSLSSISLAFDYFRGAIEDACVAERLDFCGFAENAFLTPRSSMGQAARGR
jgi:hypothetical protein